MAKILNMRASAPKFGNPQIAKGLDKRAALSVPTANDTPPSLGPLAELPGKWVGTGMNVISLPDFQGGKKFRLMVNKTIETFEFSDIGAPIPNRGNVEKDIDFLGIHYLQEVNDADTKAALHLETGIWLNLPADPPSVNSPNSLSKAPSVVRMSTIPHGDSLLSQGVFFTTNNLVIDPVDATPFTLDPVTGARKNDNSDTYLAPFKDASSFPSGITPELVLNPNQMLIDDNNALAAQGQKIISSVVLHADATPVGGINGTPVSPSPSDVGGIVNIPFVVKNANAISMSCIFWIETIQNPDKSTFMRLQYTQTVLLDFAVPGPDGNPIDIKWPHISVATLVKR